MKRILLASAAVLALALPVKAETLRYSGATPALTMDPHATNDFVTTAIFRQPRFRSEVHHRQALFEMRAQARMKKGPGGENFDRRSLR